MKKTPLHFADVFQTAGDIISQIGWTKGEFARNKKREEVKPTSKEACSFCALGALDLARSLSGRKYGRYEFEYTFMKYLHKVSERYNNYFHFIENWNDSIYTTKKEVVDAFYQCAEIIRQEHRK